MDWNWYKENIKTYSDVELKEQTTLALDCREMCWHNAEDCYGSERERWLDEYNECKTQYEYLTKEKERRQNEQ